MELTEQQRLTLKAAILADPVKFPIGDYQSIADALNATASPVTKAWRNTVTLGELVEETVDQIAVFDNLTAGKRDAWNLFLRLPRFDFTRNKIRSAPGKVWPNTQRDAILTACTENARVSEVLIGGTSTTEGGVTALKREAIGTFEAQDIGAILV